MDRYILCRRIGQGTFGSVNLVRCRRTGAIYVLKRVALEDNPQDASATLQEVKVLARLSHPNIVRYRESFLLQRELCIVMDYAAGGDLKSRITKAAKERYHFREEQIITWLVQVASGLAYVHAQNIIHRDIKPQNVFLRGEVAVIGDFGLARVLSHKASLASTVVGTPHYLSPEVCRREKYTASTDVWSFACLAHELMTLRVPIDAADIVELIDKIKRNAPIAPLPKFYSQDLRDIVSACHSRSPQDRPTFAALLERPIFKRFLYRLAKPLGYNVNPRTGKLATRTSPGRVKSAPRQRPEPKIDSDDPLGIHKFETKAQANQWRQSAMRESVNLIAAAKEEAAPSAASAATTTAVAAASAAPAPSAKITKSEPAKSMYDDVHIDDLIRDVLGIDVAIDEKLVAKVADGDDDVDDEYEDDFESEDDDDDDDDDQD